MESIAAKKLTIFISEGNMWKNAPLYQAVLEELSQAGIRQVAVTRGIAGYGRDKVIHTASIVVLSTNLPIVVEAIDLEEKIDQVLPVISAMTEGALIEVMTTSLICQPADPAGDERRTL
jgi:uncharacterized protein